MKIKNYKCLGCGRSDFDTLSNEKNPNALGIYCSFCGKFFKWASKDEKNLVKMTARRGYGRGEE